MADVEKVLEICVAYEEGYAAGRMNLAVDHNGYRNKSDPYYAWLMGHNNGLSSELQELEEIRPN